jgi:hypothetical protein
LDDLGLGGCFVFSPQHIAEQRAHLSTRAAISNFVPCTLFEHVLAEVSTRLANHGHYVEDNGHFGSLALSSGVLLHERASQYFEVAVSRMSVAVFASTTNYREVRWLKANPKLRSISYFGTNKAC